MNLISKERGGNYKQVKFLISALCRQSHLMTELSPSIVPESKHSHGIAPLILEQESIPEEQELATET